MLLERLPPLSAAAGQLPVPQPLEAGQRISEDQSWFPLVGPTRHEEAFSGETIENDSNAPKEKTVRET